MLFRSIVTSLKARHLFHAFPFCPGNGTLVQKLLFYSYNINYNKIMPIIIKKKNRIFLFLKIDFIKY